MHTAFDVTDPEALRADFDKAQLPRNLGEALDHFAERNDGTTALCFFDEGISLDWRTLRAQSLRAANLLLGLGVGPRTHVAVMLPNVVEFPLTWLALAHLGAVMVPVNVHYTPREVDFILTDSEAEYLVIHESVLAAYREMEKSPVPAKCVIVVGGDGRAPERNWSKLYADAHVSKLSRIDIGPEQVLNLQYTSGTTGFPKACMLTHDYWITIGYIYQHTWACPIRRIYGGANFYYMLLQRMLINAGFSNATLFVPTRPSARSFMANVRRLECDNIALLEPVYKQPSHPDDGRNALKIANIFGLTASSQADCQERFQVLCQELYGLTETGLVTYMPAHEVAARTGSGSCGVAAPGREISIRGPDGRELDAGREGELWTRGSGMLAGYWNRPEANEELFPGDGWFRTGDIARLDGHGYCTLVGRTKDMIRRRSENIAAREVEAVMLTLSEVRLAAAVPVPDPYSGEEVKVYLELQPGVEPSSLLVERVIEHAGANLASFKVPRYIEFRADLPTTTDTLRVEKAKLLRERDDLRIDAYDRKDGIWR